MTKLLRGCALAVALALPLAAGASPRDQDCARQGKQDCQMKKIDFERGDSLEGATPTAEGDTVTTRPPTTFGRLLKLRTDFHDRIVRAAERI
jgi:hypothetical protein